MTTQHLEILRDSPLGKNCRVLFDTCKQNTKFHSSAGARAAVALRMCMHPADSEYIRQGYQNLCEEQFHQINTPALNWLERRRSMVGPHSREDQTTIFTKFFVAFDPSQRDSDAFQFGTRKIKTVEADMREIILAMPSVSGPLEILNQKLGRIQTPK